MDNQRTLSINLAASFMVTGINICINLLVVPQIVNQVGSEAYGFVSLANNLVNYASIVTIALNSVSSRFIALAVYRGQEKEANEYYNSVFWADFALCALTLAAGIGMAVFIDSILNVPPELVGQVRALFLWLVFHFILSVIGTAFTVATYITNKLYLSSLANAAATLAKAALLLLLFGFLPVNIAYVGMASFAYSAIALASNRWFTKSLTPGLRLSVKSFSAAKTKEMLLSGSWSSVTKLSAILSEGLDTLITNLFLDGAALGALSVAYTIPTLSATLGSSICALFNPQLTYLYAKEDTDGIVGELKKNMKLTGIFIGTLFCGIVTFGREFFSLLVPNEDIGLIYHLACLSSISLVASGITSALINVFILTNKLKVNSLVWLAVGFLDTAIVLILLQATPWGVYAVAGVSKVSSLLLYFIYLPIYASHCLKRNPFTFYPLIFRYLGVIALCLLMFYGIRALLPIGHSWAHFFLGAALCGGAGVFLNSLLLLEKSERRYLRSKIQRKLRGR